MAGEITDNDLAFEGHGNRISNQTSLGQIKIKEETSLPEPSELHAKQHYAARALHYIPSEIPAGPSRSSQCLPTSRATVGNTFAFSYAAALRTPHCNKMTTTGYVDGKNGSKKFDRKGRSVFRALENFAVDANHNGAGNCSDGVIGHKSWENGGGGGIGKPQWEMTLQPSRRAGH